MNSGQVRVLKKLSVIDRRLILGGNLKRIVTFGTKCFVRYPWYVPYLGYPLLEGFTVTTTPYIKVLFILQQLKKETKNLWVYFKVMLYFL